MAGQVNNSMQGSTLIEGLVTDYVLADKGYDAEAFVAQIEAQGATTVIPLRRVFTRFDKLVKTYFNTVNIFEVGMK